LTGAEPAWEPLPALTDGGVPKLGKPVGGVVGVCTLGWGADCAEGWGPDCADGWAPNPPDGGLPAVGVGIAVCVGMTF